MKKLLIILLLFGQPSFLSAQRILPLKVWKANERTARIEQNYEVNFLEMRTLFVIQRGAKAKNEGWRQSIPIPRPFVPRDSTTTKKRRYLTGPRAKNRRN